MSGSFSSVVPARWVTGRARVLERILAIAVAWALAGCGSEDPPRGATTMERDSAGVRIVESAEPVWRAHEGWRIAAEPALEIGEVEGEPHYEFGRVTGGTRLGDGTIVVADEGAMELRYFDAQGEHLVSVGGQGSGPGEFEDLTLLGTVPGDSVVVWDQRQGRVSIFGPEGEFSRTESLRPSAEGGLLPRPSGVYPDGSLLTAFPSVMDEVPSHGTVVQDSVRLWRYHYRTGARERLVSLPSFETLFWRDSTYQVPYGLDPSWALHGDELYIAPGVEHEVKIHSPDGRLGMRMRHLRNPVAVSDEDAEVALEFVLQTASDRDADAAGAVGRLPVPEHRPAYDDLLVDEDGNVWARHYRSLYQAWLEGDWQGPSTWSVFRPDGALLGEVQIPSELTVLHVGPDALLAMWRDELGVPFVRLYPLRRAGGRGNAGFGRSERPGRDDCYSSNISRRTASASRSTCSGRSPRRLTSRPRSTTLT